MNTFWQDSSRLVRNQASDGRSFDTHQLEVQSAVVLPPLEAKNKPLGTKGCWNWGLVSLRPTEAKAQVMRRRCYEPLR